MHSITPRVGALVASLLLMTACGGGSSSDASEKPPPTSSETTTSEPTTPVPPDPPGDDLPDWASGEMTTVESDTGPLELPVELVPFCESSRAFYVAARGLDFLGDRQFGAFGQLLAALGALAPIAIDAAPSDDLAVEPTAAGEQLSVLIPAFAAIDNDPSRVQELPDPESVLDTLTEFGATRASLQQFLTQACGADVDVLDEQARGAATAAAEAAGESTPTTEAVTPADGDVIRNDSETTEVAVPAGWSDIDQALLNGRSTLAASPDLEAFAARTAPGVLVLRGEGGFRDGGFVGRVLDFQHDLEESGCVLLDDRDYDDGTFLGQERIFDCGTDGFDVRLFGGATADESLYAMVLLVNPIDEPGIRQLIINSFLVS